MGRYRDVALANVHRQSTARPPSPKIERKTPVVQLKRENERENERENKRERERERKRTRERERKKKNERERGGGERKREIDGKAVAAVPAADIMIMRLYRRVPRSQCRYRCASSLALPLPSQQPLTTDPRKQIPRAQTTAPQVTAGSARTAYEIDNGTINY